MAYIGTQPKDVRSFGRAKFDFTATQGQTAFTGADDDSKTLGFTDGQIEVYVNGILMDESDFTTSNGNTVTLASAANLNDIISVVAMQTDIPNSDYVPASGGTFTGETIHNQNVLVGKTASDGAVAGHELRPASFAIHTRAGGAALGARRITNNGDIAFFENANGAVGYIGTPYDGEMYVEAHGANSSGLLFTSGNTIQPRKNRAADDGNITIGASGNRFKDLYLSGGIHLGGTDADHKLDDYEEGTWTPEVWKTSKVGMQNEMGSYIKVGNLVWLSGYVYHGSCSSSGTDNWEIRNLPFNVKHLTNAAYQFLSTGYMNLGGTFRVNDHSRWQANHVDKLTMYADFYNINCSNQAFETSFTGILRVA